MNSGYILWEMVVKVSGTVKLIISFFLLIVSPDAIVFDKISGNFRLLPGRYNYTFQCLLPPNMPASLEGTDFLKISIMTKIYRDNFQKILAIFVTQLPLFLTTHQSQNGQDRRSHIKNLKCHSR